MTTSAVTCKITRQPTRGFVVLFQFPFVFFSAHSITIVLPLDVIRLGFHHNRQRPSGNNLRYAIEQIKIDPRRASQHDGSQEKDKEELNSISKTFTVSHSMHDTNNVASHFLLPLVILNPIIMLHSLNFLLTRTTSILRNENMFNLQPRKFLSRVQPRLDIHENENLCWGFCAVMVIVQFFAFMKLDHWRKKRKQTQSAELEKLQPEKDNSMRE